jgi:HAD superfamily hydrolase (TIGR01509 family)
VHYRLKNHNAQSKEIMKKYYLMILALTSFSCPAHIILVDNTVVLKKTDILTLSQEVFKGISAWRVPLLLPRAAGFEKQFFDILNRMPVSTHYKAKHNVLYNGSSVPKIMEHWTINARSSTQTLSLVNSYIDKAISDSTQRQLFKNLARMSFDPHAAAKLFTPDSQILSLLAQCKQKGHTLILATNWNAESLNSLRQKFKSAYQLFDDIAISSPTRSKPQKDFYIAIIQKYHAQPSDCIAIETEAQFVKNAQKSGLKSLIYTGNAQSIKRGLKTLKVL